VARGPSSWPVAPAIGLQGVVAVNIYKVLPDLKQKRQLALWHKALRAQWSAEDMNWGAPQRITKDHLKDQLGRVLTPVLMGEQSALYSVSTLIPILGHRSEVESQFYLTTWAVDEARHTELFARFYHRLDREPLSIRRFPAGYIFQSQIASKDAGEWLSGVLVSEVLAKLIMEEFRRLDLDPVLSEISHGILEDEARHLGFNHVYMEERFRKLYRENTQQGEAYADQLRRRLRKVRSYVPKLFEALEVELEEVGVDSEGVLHRLTEETDERLETSIRRGQKTAASEAAASPQPAATGS
jgi:CRP-like cAMP-binding protein